MSDEAAREARAMAADQRDMFADGRDAIADERDLAADERDEAARARDRIAQAREHQLAEWERQLAARAEELGLALEADEPVADDLTEAAAAREVAAQERAERREGREAASVARTAATERRLAARHDALLAAAFAGVAENLHHAETFEDLLTRVAKAAVAMVAGSTTATVELPTLPGTDGSTLTPGASQADAAHSVLSVPFEAPVGTDGPSGTALLNIFAPTPQAFDDAARVIGYLLGAHASLAARAVGERIRLEHLGERLEQALLSRDVIGRAKGILAERLAVTDQEAFDILRRASQRLNVKLREVASRLAETGQVDPRDI